MNFPNQQNKSKTILEELEREYSENTNDFPLDVFPETVQSFILEVTKSLDFNLDFISCSTLVAFSTAIGNLFTLEIKEGYTQKSNLWMVIVGKAGDGKSPAMETTIKPLRLFEKRAHEKYIDELKQWELSSNGQYFSKPKKENKILTNFTFESLVKEHSNNKLGLCIYSDEILSWISSFGKYSGSSEENDYLSIWNGGVLKSNRKNSEDFFIDESYINVIGGIQSGRLSHLFKNERGESGFLDRILFCFPDNVKLIKLNRNKVNPSAFENYNVLFERIYELYDHTYLKQITYSEEAFNYACNWDNNITSKYSNEEASFQSMISKLKAYLHRFALLIEVINCIANDNHVREVSINSLRKAEKLVSYFEKNAIKVKDGGSSPFSGIGADQQELFNSLPNKFRTSDAQKEGKKLKMSPSKVKRALRNTKLYNRENHGHYTKLPVF